jgi:hypothetical protein
VAAIAAVTKEPAGSPVAGKLSGGAKLISSPSGGSSSSGGSGFDLDLDLDSEVGLAILVIAVVIIALLGGVMTTALIVRRADRQVAFDVLAKTPWYEWEE